MIPRGTTEYTFVFPKEMKVFGSDNGSTWVEIKEIISLQSNFGANTWTTKYVSATTAYKYIRIVFHKSFGHTGNHAINFRELQIIGRRVTPDLVKGAISANVVHQRMTETASLSVAANGGKTEIEGLRLTITPQSSFSKVELNYSIFMEASSYDCGFVVSRTVGGTETLFTIGNNGSEDMTFIASYETDYGSTPHTVTYTMIDEPNTTGVVVYKVYGKNATSSTQTIYINRTKNDSSSAGHEHGISTSSVKEFSTFTHNIAEQKVQGRVLETLVGVCDGRTVTVSSGTYTLPNQSASQDITVTTESTAVDVIGSIISYKPPPGTRQVIYEFHTFHGWHPGQTIGYYCFYIDNVAFRKPNWFEVIRPGDYSTHLAVYRLVVDIGVADDASKGQMLSWDTLKTIKMKAYKYNSSSYQLKFGIHNANEFVPPTLEIRSIGEENLVYNLTNQYSITEGQVLETLAGVCDGRSVTVSSGTYTIENVTTSLSGTTTYTDLTGSKINYKPPPGTRQVIYEFEFQHVYDGTNGWGYYKFLLDGTQVGELFEIGFDRYGSSWQKVSFVFEIGQNDLSNGKISSWDSHKEIKMQFREHASNSQVRVHISPNNGSSLIKPRIKVQAIGRGVIEGTIGNLYSSKVNMDYKNVTSQFTYATGTGLPGTEVPEFELNIKPVHRDSIMELKYNIFYESYSIHNAIFRLQKVVDGTTSLIVPANNHWEGAFAAANVDSNTSSPHTQSLLWYDTPNSLNTVTYKLLIANSAADETTPKTFYFNRTQGSTGANGHEAGVSTCCVKELPQQTTLHNPRYNSVIEQEGQVLETLAGVCDGRSVTVSSGTYTLENVTTAQDLGLSYTVITGSSINYKPPSGTRQLIYKFFVTVYGTDGSSSYGNMFHYKLRLDGTYITNSNVTRRHGGIYEQETYCISYTIDIGGTDDIANGKIASWNEPKIIEVHARDYDSSHEVLLHRVSEMNGSGSYTTVIKPHLEITAIGRKSDTTFLNSFFNERKGQVLETLSGVCDGRTVTVDSGVYTLPNISQVQDLTTTYVDVSGSNISYKPPPGTHQVVYKFTFTVAGLNDSHPMAHFKLLIDNTEITNFRTTENGHYSLGQRTHVYIFEIGKTDSASEGKFLTWDTLKTIKTQVREYGSSWDVKLHQTRYWDGVSPSSQFSIPKLEIQAIGDAAIQNATVVAGHSMVHFQGYSTTYTVTSGIKYVTNYGNAPGSGISSGIPQLKNFGDCMNTSTGIFTTPHTGLYNINAINHHSNRGTNACWVELVIDNKYIQFGDHDVSYGDLGASSVYHIDSGKEVYLRIGSNDNSAFEPTAVSLTITALQDRVPQAISSRPGMTLETLSGVCDGRTVTVSSGTYTLPNITSAIAIGTDHNNWTDLNNSFSYKPPPGTKEVVYTFKAHFSGADSNGLNGLRLFLDNTEVTDFRTAMGTGIFGEDTRYITWTFSVGNVSSDDIAKGKLASWNTYKTIHVESTCWTSSYEVKAYEVRYEMPGNYAFVAPILEIQAIGDGPGIVPSTGMNVVKTTYTTQTTLTVPYTLPGVNISGLNLTIKPTATDSVIELKFNLFNEVHNDVLYRITRNIDGTDVLVVPATNVEEGGISTHVKDGNHTTTPHVTKIRWYDEPNTTSPVTYKLWINDSTDNTTQTNTLYLNRSGTIDYNTETGVSTAIAIEYPKTARPLDTENALTIPPFVGAINKEKLYNQDGDLYFNGKQLSNEWYKNAGDLYRLGGNVGIGKSGPAYKLTY